MPARLKGSSFTCGKGQIQTIEALIASAIVFASVVFALNYPKVPGFGEMKTLQLKKFCDDLLDLLSVENRTLNTTLTMWIDEIENGNEGYVNSTFYNLSLSLLKSESVLTRIEIYKNNSLMYQNGTLKTLNPNCASSFRVVLHRGEVYEVRVIACYV